MIRALQVAFLWRKWVMSHIPLNRVSFLLLSIAFMLQKSPWCSFVKIILLNQMWKYHYFFMVIIQNPLEESHFLCVEGNEDEDEGRRDAPLVVPTHRTNVNWTKNQWTWSDSVYCVLTKPCRLWNVWIHKLRSSFTQCGAFTGRHFELFWGVSGSGCHHSWIYNNTTMSTAWRLTVHERLAVRF